MKPKDLSESIAATYQWLRLGMGLTALAFPWILGIGGYLFASLPLQNSMSAYYHAGQGVMRNEFVGILFAIGAILFLFQGVSRLEDRLLNLAGILALGVALFPMTWPEGSVPQDKFFFLHGFFAIGFFGCIGLVCAFCASDTLDLLKDGAKDILKAEAKIKRYRSWYLILGVLMPTLTIGAACLKYAAPGFKWAIFLAEFLGIYVFSTFWLLKTYEISQTDFDRKAALGQLHIEPRSLTDRLMLRPMKIDLREGSK